MFEKLFRKKEEKRKTVGNLGEDLATAFLKKHGFRILDRNYRNKRGKQLGELDIVAEEAGVVVFIEVKSRECRSGDTVLPEENITFEKLRKLSKIAELWLRERKRIDRDYRFDAVTVLFCGIKEPEIRHIRNIFL
jgi:putative endonuclease